MLHQRKVPLAYGFGFRFVQSRIHIKEMMVVQRLSLSTVGGKVKVHVSRYHVLDGAKHVDGGVKTVGKHVGGGAG